MGDKRLMGIEIGFAGWQKMEGFYPPRTRSSEMLPIYAEQFDTVEVRSTFQGIPGAARVSEWVEAVPDGFRFHIVAFGGLTLHQIRPGQSENLRKSWMDVAVSPPDDIFAVPITMTSAPSIPAIFAAAATFPSNACSKSGFPFKA